LRVDRGRDEGWVGDMRLHVKDVVEEGHDVQEILLGFRHKHNDITESQRMVEDDHEVVVETLEKPTDNVLHVPMCFSPLIVVCASDVPQRGDHHGFVPLQLANKEGSVGERLKIFKGRVIPCPGERVRERVTVALAYADGIFNIVGATGNSRQVQSIHSLERAIPPSHCEARE
jgi:hypothetical protein